MKPLFTLLISLLLLVTHTNCKKKKKDSPASPVTSTGTGSGSGVDTSGNKKFSSSREISFAAWLITDIESIISYPFENQLFKGYFWPQSPSAGTVTVIMDTASKYLVVSFNNTKGKDGKIRNGSIFAQYGQDALAPHSRLSHEYKFSASITLSNYSVDGYLIQLNNVAPYSVLKNKLATSAYNPATTKITWDFSGLFMITHPLDPTYNINCTAIITKTLFNNTDPLVMTSSSSNINWDKAHVQYGGEINGTFMNNTFVYTIDPKNQISKYFICSPKTSDSLSTALHPFTHGTANFVSEGDGYVKLIDYGPDIDCDNFGRITYKGVPYGVSFY
jgi:hypothetical protein